MNKGGKTATIFVVVFILLAIILSWGYVGAKEVKKDQGTCELGIKNKLCWIWSIKEVGQEPENQTKEYMNSLGGG